uniref:Uncharacterized protein n=1 Tax=uncultured Elusimicrobia bacterium TaxID=699876 RepID=A0A650ELT2_9BACT|nr:hypothetical protein Elusimicrob1349_1890 [uncultured Elusimicrobia bacterium]
MNLKKKKRVEIYFHHKQKFPPAGNNPKTKNSLQNGSVKTGANLQGKKEKTKKQN